MCHPKKKFLLFSFMGYVLYILFCLYRLSSCTVHILFSSRYPMCLVIQSGKID